MDIAIHIGNAFPQIGKLPQVPLYHLYNVSHLLLVFPTPTATLLQQTLGSTSILISVILVLHSSRPPPHRPRPLPSHRWQPLLDLVKHLSHLFIHLDVLELGILGCKNLPNWVYSPYQKKKLNHPTQRRRRRRRNGTVTYRPLFLTPPHILPHRHRLVRVNQNQDLK
jgi:hypothetical protein